MTAATPEPRRDGVAPYRPLPDDEEFIGIIQSGSFYAEVTAFRRLAATIGVEQTYRKWTKLQRRARVSDEQPQAERDAEPKPCVCGDPNCMPYWRPVHEQMNTMRIRLDKTNADFTKSLLEQVCELATELDELRARSEDGEAERDADVRAVAVACVDFGNDEGPRGIRQLYARFAERIAALDAREGGEASCPCGCPVVPDMCSCPEPCPCEPDCAYCLVPNPSGGA